MCRTCLKAHNERCRTSKAHFIFAVRDGAKSRGRSVSITDEQIWELAFRPCQYCGGMDDRGFNGLDRVNNGEGYNLGNVVPCCKVCNRMKGTMDSDEFLSQIRRISNFVIATVHEVSRC